MFLPLIEYMHKRNINVVKVDMLIHSENGYAILKEELKQLREHFGSPRCLNPNNEPIMPQWKAPKKEGERGTFNWLTQNEYLNFKKLLKKPIPVV